MHYFSYLTVQASACMRKSLYIVFSNILLNAIIQLFILDVVKYYSIKLKFEKDIMGKILFGCLVLPIF